MNTSVSVVIPVGRVDTDLHQQMEALSCQQAEFEVEFVLAHNTSDAREIMKLRELVADFDDDRFRIVPAPNRRGAAHARNVGARAALGAVLAFCDSDDVVHQCWLREIVARLDDFDAVGGRLVDVGLTERQRLARPPATPDDLPRFLGVPYMGSGNMAIRHAAFDDVGGFDEDLIRCEDIALSWDLIERGYRLGFASDAVVDYRHRPGAIPMLKQHVAYGRGMSQVLIRYGIPGGDDRRSPSGIGLLRPNAQRVERRTLLGVLRRGAVAVGRTLGIAEETYRRHRTADR